MDQRRNSNGAQKIENCLAHFQQIAIFISIIKSPESALKKILTGQHKKF